MPPPVPEGPSRSASLAAVGGEKAGRGVYSPDPHLSRGQISGSARAAMKFCEMAAENSRLSTAWYQVRVRVRDRVRVRVRVRVS